MAARLVGWMVGVAFLATSPVAQAADLKVMVPTVSMPDAVGKKLQLAGPQLTTLLAEAVTKLSGHTVITEEDVKALLTQAARPQLLGCQDMACALDVSRMANADLLLRGEIGLVGDRLLVSGTLINVHDARVINIVSRPVAPEQLATGGLAVLVSQLFNKAGAPGDSAVVAPEPPAPPPGQRERLLVAAGQWSDAAGDAAVKRSALGKAAQAIQAMNRHDVITAEELASVLKSEAELQQLGAGNAETFGKVATALNARWVVLVDAGKAGDALVVGAALLDAQKTEVLGRSSVVFKESRQVLDAVDVAARKLFGEAAMLPAPDADPNGLDKQIAEMAASLSTAYTRLPQGGTAGLALLPFADTSPDTKARKLGSQLSSFLQHNLTGKTPVQMVDSAKTAELSRTHDLQAPLMLGTPALQEMGMFLGAQALVLGTVGELGTDFVLQVRLVKTSTGEVLFSGNVLMPKARPGQLLPKKLVVTRSRADALTRAVVPGLAQFTAGPLGIVKGAALDAVVLGGVLLLVPAVASAVVGALFYLGNLGINRIDYVSADNCLTGSDPECVQRQQLGIVLIAVGAVVGVVGVVAAAAAYGVSFVDAALFGAREEELDFEAAH